MTGARIGRLGDTHGPIRLRLGRVYDVLFFSCHALKQIFGIFLRPKVATEEQKYIDLRGMVAVAAIHFADGNAYTTTASGFDPSRHQEQVNRAIAALNGEDYSWRMA